MYVLNTYKQQWFIHTYICICRCHGKGVLEIKCPQSLTEKSFQQMCETPSFCLEKRNGEMRLKKDHEYYFQVQAQLHIVEAAYCDFMVWSPQPEPPHIERIYPDATFFDLNLSNVIQLLKLCIIPEIVGKLFTVPRTEPRPALQTVPSNGIGCYCCEPDDGDMLVCLSGKCTRVRFHKKCLRLDKVKKNWKCIECTKVCNKEKRDKKKSKENS